MMRQGTNVAIVLLVLILGPHDLRAGLVPSEVVVVVNKSSLDSRTLANHYIALRNIPAANVVVLDNVPNSEVISIADFREKILQPLLQEIDRRKLGNHIQCIAYSADFPTAIDIQTDLQPLGKLPIFITPRASINALTYFYANVLANDPSYVDLNANKYARRELEAFFTNPYGKLTEAAWAKIQERIAAGDHAQAAEALVELLKEYPQQFPIAYLAAVEFAQADNTEEAIAMLEKAVALGWNAGGYLSEDERLSKLREDSRFQLLLLSLDETIVKYQPSLGFEAQRWWTGNGVATLDPPKKRFGGRYLLSIVLGVTRGAGTTLNEAIEVLERAASADFTQPQGGFYFCLTSDVRTVTRQPGFADAVESLKGMGYKAEVVKQVLPERRKDILGAMVGTANFDWSTSRSTLLPGSIAENLTSIGAVMNSLGGQTKLTEFLKAGAAGSSGTVTEPYALQPKFPHPQLYVHYARGLSLMESFYASVTGPYQLLIIGDPLCQPFASPPLLKIDSSLRKLALKESLKTPLNLETEAADGKRPPQGALHVSVIFDGATVQRSAIQRNLDVKMADQAPGYHFLRLIVHGDDATAQRREVELPIWLGDRKQEEFSISVPESIKLKDRTVEIQVAAKGAKEISLWHESEKLGSVSGDQGEFSTPLESLGTGPIRLHLIAEMPEGPAIRSIPKTVTALP
jgi:hypothetical protein